MDIILLAITVASLVVALVMGVAAWRVTRDEKTRAAARVAALSLAAKADQPAAVTSFQSREAFASPERPAMKAPWSAPPSTARPSQLATAASLRSQAQIVSPAELPLNEARPEPPRSAEPSVSHASGFLGVTEVKRDNGSRQKTLAIAALILFATLAGGLVWVMSGPRGTSAAAIGPNSPLELVSLSHQRQNEKLASRSSTSRRWSSCSIAWAHS